MKIFEYSSAPHEKRKQDTSGLLKIVSVLILMACSAALGYYLAQKSSADSPKNVLFSGDVTGSKQAGNDKIVDFNKYWSILNQIDAKYPGKIDKQKMFETSLKGLVEGVADAPTQYFSADEYSQYLKLTAGESFSGIGIEFEVDANGAKIINVFDGSPAKSIPLYAGDIITKVDNDSLAGKTTDEMSLKIKGEKGSKVKLEVLREGKLMSFETTRNDITVPAILFKKLDNNIAYIDVKRFTAKSFEEWTKQWDQAVKQVNEMNPSGLVIDLRSDGGGFVASSIYAASDFLDPGKTIVSEKAKDTILEEDKSVTAMQRLSKYKTVILVDKYTASASEIFSGALRNYNKATIIGQDTYGKGTVQQIFDKELGDGSALKLTIANWVLPNGRIISKDTPINPDIKIDQDQEALKKGVDNVLNRGLEELKK